MTDSRVSQSAELLAGAIDLYVHANPDLLPRLEDEIGLAASLRDAGLKAAVHRHHYRSTAESSALARRATGFSLLGAVEVHDTIGGLNPVAVEFALRMGAAWVALPMLAAQAFRSALAESSPGFRDDLRFGPGRLRLTDDDGALLPQIREILDLVGRSGATLGLGYVSYAETMAVVSAAPSHKIRAMVLTHMGLSLLNPEQIRAIVAQPGVRLEIVAYTMHPGGPVGRHAAAARRSAFDLIRAVGVDKCVVSSDGGMAGAPPPAELLLWLYEELLAEGFSHTEITRMSRLAPAEILGVAMA